MDDVVIGDVHAIQLTVEVDESRTGKVGKLRDPAARSQVGDGQATDRRNRADVLAVRRNPDVYEISIGSANIDDAANERELTRFAVDHVKFGRFVRTTHFDNHGVRGRPDAA